MKTAISVPDALFARADRLARRLGKSRSRIFAEAVGEYLARRDPDEVTERMNAAIAEVGGAIDPFAAAAGRRVLERSEW